MSYSRTQHSDSCEARTRCPLSRVKHSTTALPRFSTEPGLSLYFINVNRTRSAAVHSKAVVLLLFIHCLLLLPMMVLFLCVRSLLCFAVLCVQRKLVALLWLNYSLNAITLLSFLDPSSRWHGLACSV